MIVICNLFNWLWSSNYWAHPSELLNISLQNLYFCTYMHNQFFLKFIFTYILCVCCRRPSYANFLFLRFGIRVKVLLITKERLVKVRENWTNWSFRCTFDLYDLCSIHIIHLLHSFILSLPCFLVPNALWIKLWHFFFKLLYLSYSKPESK